jgi:adenylate cyclase
VERRLAAILAADVVGYSRLIGVDETGTLSMLRALRKDLVQPTIAGHRGRIFKLMGDGLLAEFSSVVDAVTAAVEIQKAVPERTSDLPENKRIALRIGVTVGDIVVEDGDIFGDGVNIAARLETLSPPNGIAISDGTYRELRGKLDMSFSDAGEQSLKNIAAPLRVWLWPPETAAPTPYVQTRKLELPDKPSIAVLPFDNMSGDPEQEFIADGIAEDIITELSRLRGFFVIARNSSFTYKGQSFSISDVAQALGVRYVLEGSVRRSGNRIRVTAQLIEGLEGTHIWAERYDRTLDDIFELQDEITQQIVGALEPNLLVAEAERSRRQLPENINAWGYVARAIPLICTLTSDDYEAGAALLEKAIEIDPNYARAHSVLAVGLVTTAWLLGKDKSREALDKAMLAVKLDPQDPWGHLALGHAYGFRRRSKDAIAAMEEALRLNPNFALARGFYGLVLGWAGDGEQALAQLDLAERLSPRDALNFHYPSLRSVAHFATGDYDAAAEQARQGIRLNSDATGPYRVLAASCGQLGQLDEARSTVERLLQLQPDITLQWARNNIPVTDPGFLDRYIDGLHLAGLPE